MIEFVVLFDGKRRGGTGGRRGFMVACRSPPTTHYVPATTPPKPLTVNMDFFRLPSRSSLEAFFKYLIVK